VTIAGMLRCRSRVDLQLATRKHECGAVALAPPERLLEDLTVDQIDTLVGRTGSRQISFGCHKLLLTLVALILNSCLSSMIGT